MVITDKYLKDYALKIYKHIPGYTFSKVFSLFPKYAGVIMSYYEEFTNKDKINQITQTGFFIATDFAQRVKSFTNNITKKINAINANYDAERKKLDDKFRGDTDRDVKTNAHMNMLKYLNIEQAYKLTKLSLIEMNTYTKIANETAPIFGADVADTIYKMNEVVLNYAKPFFDAIKEAANNQNEDANIRTIADAYTKDILNTLPNLTKNY